MIQKSPQFNSVSLNDFKFGSSKWHSFFLSVSLSLIFLTLPLYNLFTMNINNLYNARVNTVWPIPYIFMYKNDIEISTIQLPLYNSKSEVLNDGVFLSVSLSLIFLTLPLYNESKYTNVKNQVNCPCVTLQPLYNKYM